MILITFAVILIPYGYTAWRLIKALAVIYPNHIRLIKYTIISFFIFISLLPPLLGLSYLLGQYGNWFSSADEISILDILFLYPFWLGLLIVLESFPYFLLSDALLFATRWFVKFKSIPWIKWIALLKLVIFIFFFIFVGIRVYLDTRRIVKVCYDIPVANLAPGLETLNLVLSADVQVDPFTPDEKISSYTKLIQSVSPDIHFFAGDLVTSGTRYIDDGLRVLCQTKAGLARIACLGDHDIWADAGRIRDGLVNCGWEFLDDQHHLLTYQGAKILVTGVSFVYSKKISPKKLKDLLDHAPQADLKILLVHQPSEMVISAAARYGYHLLLAGHTHGGQIIIKPFGFSVTPTMFENDFYSGFEYCEGMPVIITSGIGMSIIPLRYRAQAEIVQFRLVRKP
jgi:predicted MPP superfamily phosphohydrolase